jgi:lipoic acid synthetase
MHKQELFDNRPKVAGKKRKSNKLPENPEQDNGEKAVGLGRFPSWLHRKLPKGNILKKTSDVLEGNRLHTVCEEAKCPNLLECYSKKTATFLLMGNACTRACGFCDIDFAKNPPPLDIEEPANVANSVKVLGLKHVVMTMVARDDMVDGGAEHLVNVIEVVRQECPEVTVEILTSDFYGNEDAWNTVLDVQPEIFNYNIETTREMTPRIRHKATYDRTLKMLKFVKDKRRNDQMLVKSGIMVGLGESDEEVRKTIADLKEAGVDIITIGQYLQASPKKLRVKAFITPEQFKAYETFGYSIGVSQMYCGPFVRSSYNAHEVKKLAEKRSVQA